MKKWHQKSIAIFTAATCLLAGGTIGLSQESLSKLQLTAAAETENTNLVGASFGLELEYDYLDDGTLEITKFVSSYSTRCRAAIHNRGETNYQYRTQCI